MPELELDIPRAERVQRVFGITPTDYQAKLLNYGQQTEKAQTAPKKGRQVGATLTAGMIGADHALFPPEVPTDVLFAAPSQGTANEMFRECKKLFWNSDYTLSELGVEEDNKETWEFSTGTRILARTLGNVEQSNNSGNRGMNPTCVIVDEAAYTKDAVYTEEIEEFFITHENFEFHLFSTPAGQSGYFYEKVEEDGIRDYEDALSEDWAWYSPYWPTKISPYAQEDFIEQKREEFDEATFAQEFLGEFQGGGSLIGADTVAQCVGSLTGPSESRYLGVDPAGGGDDEMVVYDLGASGMTHNIWSWQETSGPEFLDYLTRIVRGEMPPETTVGSGLTPENGYESVVVEKNGIGEYGSDFAERDLGDVINPVSSGRESKHTMYKRLVRDLEASDIVLPNYRKLKNQLTSLQKDMTPTGYWKVSHPPGGHDDYCFTGDTPITTPAGKVPIKDLSVGDMVITREGPRPIVATGSREAEVIERFGVRATPDHPVITHKGIRRFDKVAASELIYTWNVKPSCSTATPTIATPAQTTANSANTIGRTPRTAKAHTPSTATNGGMNTAKSLTGTSFTIRTATAPITPLPTSSVWNAANINPCTPQSGLATLTHTPNSANNWTMPARKRPNGTVPKKARSGIRNTTRTSKTNSTRNGTRTNATFAEMSSSRTAKSGRGSVLKTAGTCGGTETGKKSANANGVEMSTKQTSTQTERTARKAAPCSTTTATVHNITVAGAHEYFAGDILVHNCDALMLANGARTGLAGEFRKQLKGGGGVVRRRGAIPGGNN